MSILTLHNLAKYYGAQDVFRGISASIARGDKVALVGPNGAGKTTLIRILLGLEEPTEGSVARARDVTIGYLPQHPEFDSDQTVYGEMLRLFAHLQRQQQALEALAQEMAAHPTSDGVIERYAEAEHRFEAEGGYEYEQRIQRVLSGLGFGPETYAWPISVLSGGQVTRALLARLLLEEPELLVLDEPTNYLDLAALEWLESYLVAWKRSLLVISHDRYFLDHVVSRIWDLNHGTIETYRGNYSAYLVQREDRRLRQEREYQAQQESIAKTEEFIRRYKAGQRSKEAQGRLTRLERLERVEAPPEEHQIRLRLTTNLRSGDKVLMSEGVTIGYTTQPDAPTAPTGERPMVHRLFESGPILVERGDRVALLGANGSGKTTFLRTVLQQLAPLEGSIRLGASVKIGYLPQKQDWLDPDKTVLDQVMDASRCTIEEARTLLGRYLFTGDDVFKRTGNLSGGEQSRVALALLALNGANLLFLDEPTTHLDVASQEILQDVLVRFRGTILFVSHDRYLIDALATHVYWIEDGRLHTLEGNYTEWVTLRREAVLNKSAQENDGGREYGERRRQQREVKRSQRRKVERLDQVEAEIERLESELAAKSGQLERASAAQDVGRVHALGHEYKELEAALALRLRDWESLAEEPDDDA
jgi:ATP-binding cassette subfamily F protein 3